MAKRIISLFMTLVLLAGLLTVAAVPASAASFDGGDGSRDDPYLISTAAQLKAFRDLVNGGSRSACAKLTNNIDLERCDWDPIGLSSSGYTGIFDGNGYAIRNLEVSKASTGTSSGSWTLFGCGLFGIVGRGGVVKNLNVDGVITMNGTQPKDIDLGCICGGNLGTIEECFVTVNFRDFDLVIQSPTSSSMTTIGGICGVNSGVIRNCYVVGSINVTMQTRKMHVGGLVGDTDVSGTTVENCYAAVDLKVNTNGTAAVGGLFGYLGSKGTFKNLHANQAYCSNLVATGSGASYLEDCSLLSTSTMKSAAFAARMGSAFAVDKDNVNDGYPILAALVYEEESDWSEWFEDEAMGDNVNKEIFNALIPAELKNKDLTKSITRAEFCAVAVQLYEEMGGPRLNAASLDTPFVDTSSDAVKKAYKLGITNGTSATTFDPYTLISREQLATMLTRVYKSLNLPGWTLATDSSYKLDYSGTTKFADDGYISAYAKPSVYFMVKNGVIKGLTATTFAPRNVTTYEQAIGYANASREQALIMAVRMFQKL